MLHRLFSSVPGDKLSDSRLPEVPGKKVYADVFPAAQLHCHTGHKYPALHHPHAVYKQLHNHF